MTAAVPTAVTGDALLGQMRQIVGASHVLTDEQSTRRFRKGHRTGEGNVLAVVRPGSLLEHYKRFLAFRRQHPALTKGAIDFMESDGDTVAFTRREGNERIVCAFNLGAKPAEIDLGQGAMQPLPGHGFSGQAGTGPVRLGAYGAWFGRMD